MELGLYGKRIEARTLKEMIAVLEKLEGVVPPDVRSRIRGAEDEELLNRDTIEDRTPDEGVRDGMDVEDGTLTAEDM